MVGAPAVESTECGIGTSSKDLDSSRELDDDSVDSLKEDVPVVSTEEVEPVTSDKVAERRQLLQKQLKRKRDSKLTKKLSTDNQLLAMAREDLQLKRKVFDQMEEADKKHQKTMDSLLQGFTSLISALHNGFSLVGSLLSQPAAAQPSSSSTAQEMHLTASFYDFPDFSYRSMNRNNDFAKS